MTRVRSLRDDERPWVRDLIRERWADEIVACHGTLYRPDTLPGFVAEDDDGARVGLLTYVLDGAACEVVTIDALVPGKGHGRSLVEAAEAVARDAGCSRLWLTATNDNVRGLAFYRALGFRVVAVHEGAVTEVRNLKASIPLVSEDGVPITDEVELERRL